MSPKYSYAARCDVGRKRQNNEDSFNASPEHQLFLVCDGMGGHAAGEVASQISVATVADFFNNHPVDGDATWPFEYNDEITMNANRLVTGIILANQKILEAIVQKPELQGMGSTAVGAVFDEGRAWVAHVGDSRGYLVRDKKLSQITTDHSWIAEQVKLGLISREEAEHHPFRNVITRALGTKGELKVDIDSVRMLPGDLVILCSDGLNSMLSDSEIESLAAIEPDSDLEKVCESLISAANARGGHDNVTVILVRCDDPGPVVAPEPAAADTSADITQVSETI
jgi:serine/threonine protein phosphatase PrpC